jgi:toxic protein SymE
MADANLNARPYQHILTIKQAPRDVADMPWGAKLPSRHPWLRLSGKWLVVEAGFMPEQRVRVQVEYQRIVITPFD